MREPQTVYVRVDGKPKDVIADFRIKPIEAIVLTPEQYREDMILFAKFFKNEVVRIEGEGFRVKSKEGLFSQNDLFDLYQKEVNTPKEK